MTACLLLGLVCSLPAADEDKLLEQLSTDFMELLKKEKDPEPLQQAAAWLETSKKSSNWPDYQAALKILRQRRSKAAVPLLLKAMVEHSPLGTGHVTVPAFAVRQRRSS